MTLGILSFKSQHKEEEWPLLKSGHFYILKKSSLYNCLKQFKHFSRTVKYMPRHKMRKEKNITKIVRPQKIKTEGIKTINIWEI